LPLDIHEPTQLDHQSVAALVLREYPYRVDEVTRWRAGSDLRGQRWVGRRGAGIAAYASLWPFSGRRYRFDLVVHSRERGRGIGGELLDFIEAQAHRIGAATLQARALASSGASLDFLGHRGFTETMRMYWMELAVPHGPPDERSDVPRAIGDALEIVRLCDVSAEARCWERLAALQNAARQGWVSADPGAWEPEVTPAELRRELGEYSVIPEAFFIARAGEEYVGYSALGSRTPDADLLQSVGTAVHPEWRDRGIATALKRCTIHFARERGVSRVRAATGHPAMLHVDQKLGFHETHVEVRLVRRVGS
jgi:GNAT superfamily N-acetyltransferase